MTCTGFIKRVKLQEFLGIFRDALNYEMNLVHLMLSPRKWFYGRICFTKSNIAAIRQIRQKLDWHRALKDAQDDSGRCSREQAKWTDVEAAHHASRGTA